MPYFPYYPEGMNLFSPENIAMTATKESLEDAMRQGAIVEGSVIKCESDFRLLLRVGAFEGSIEKEEIALTRDGEEVRDIAAITRVGKAAAVMIKEIKEQNGKIHLVLSRKMAQKQCKIAFLCTLRPGDIVTARVTHMEQFGAFVDIGCGIVSLLSIDCISISRISHPRDRLHVGQLLRVVIKSLDPERERIYVSLRELLGTWEENAAAFQIGQTLPGIVRSVEEYGIFVELAPNLAGLAEYRDGIAPHTGVSVFIKNIIPEKMKIKLVIIEPLSVIPPRGELPLFIGEGVSHISSFTYSPPGSGRSIQTVFDGE